MLLLTDGVSHLFPKDNDKAWERGIADPVLSFVNIYSAPSTRSFPWRRLRSGDIAEYIRIKNWYVVRVLGLRGWCPIEELRWIDAHVGDDLQWMLNFSELERRIINNARVFGISPYPDPGSALKLIISKMADLMDTSEKGKPQLEIYQKLAACM